MPSSTASATADFNAVRDHIRSLLKRPGYDDGHIGPVLIRLAWHASGTFCRQSQSGGSDGATMRFYSEAADGANAGLDAARAFLEPVKRKFPWLSYGDLWTLAGCVAVESMGGPSVPWRPGRVDKNSESECPPNGRLPDATQGAQHLRDVFYRMGFNDQEIVALSGAHTLGRCHQTRSGFVGPWTYTPTRFSNQYFKLLLTLQWKPVTKYPGGPVQFENKEGDLMMLPTDMVLLEDKSFRKWVEIYAEDKDRFYKDFSKAFATLLELGVKNPGKVSIVCPYASAQQSSRI